MRPRLPRALVGLASATIVVCALGASAPSPSASARVTQEPAVRIPLRAGLTIVTAVALERGDGESIKRLATVDADRVIIMYSSEIAGAGPANPAGDLLAFLGGGQPDPKAAVKRLAVERSVWRKDLKAARHYEATFSTSHPVAFPGSTAVGTSSDVLQDLKARGEAAFTCTCGPRSDAAGDKLGRGMAGLLGGTAAPLEMKHLDVTGTAEGRLKRVEPAAVRLPVIVNGQRVELPAIHATGRVGVDDGDFYFLDDVENPIALRWRVGAYRLQVVKIAFPDERGAGAQIEAALATAGRAEVYGIYFDTASATIKPESEAVLKEIADALAKNPAWRINVEGHTDNVGGDAYNLELSRRRAAAVTAALTGTYRVATDRLTPAGFGASRPKETNATLEGRARNRRVELVRQ